MPKNSTSTFSQCLPLHRPSLAAATLKFLHNHDALMRTQPLVSEIVPLQSAPSYAPQDESGPDYKWYRQTEYVTFLPGVTKKIVFENWFRDLEDGVDSKAYAPAGLRIRAVYRVQRQGQGGDGPAETAAGSGIDTVTGTATGLADESKGEAEWLLTEETEMECNLIVKWLSERQHQKAHRKMLESIVAEAKKTEQDAGEPQS